MQIAASWSDIDTLWRELRARGEIVDEATPASPATIAAVEEAVGVRFPSSYREFLLRYGAGGPVGAEFCGIWNDVPGEMSGANVVDVTLLARKEGLPKDYVVVKGPAEDGEIWCLDLSQEGAGEAPVVFLERPYDPKFAVSQAKSFLEYLAMMLGDD